MCVRACVRVYACLRACMRVKPRSQYDAELGVASRRVALGRVATSRVVHNFCSHARVRRTGTTPSALYAVQSTKFTIDHEMDLEIVLLLPLYLRQRRSKCGRSMWFRGIFTRSQ